MPTFEVKASSKFLSYCCPSMHKDGHQIEILGVQEPAVLIGNTIDDMQNHLDSISRKYDLVGDSEQNRIPISDLFKNDTVIYEGHNRHEALLRAIDSLLRRTAGTLSIDQIEQLCRDWNTKHCQPILDDREFQKQWKSAIRFITNSSDDKSTGDNKAPTTDGDASNNPPREDYEDEHPDAQQTSESADQLMSEEELDYIDDLINEYNLKTLNDTEDLWRYDNRVYLYPMPNP